MITDQPERFIAAEIIREKIIHLTREELPYAVAVVIEEIAPRGKDLLVLRAEIFVERESQVGDRRWQRRAFVKESRQCRPPRN